MYSTGSEKGTIPQVLFDVISEEFGPFDLDAAASPDDTKVAVYYSKEENGLKQPWHGRVWLNPPYGRGMSDWIQRCYDQVASGEAELVVALLPSSDGYQMVAFLGHASHRS